MRRFLSLFLAICCTISLCAKEKPMSEREALIQLYKATDGKHWLRNNGWKSRQPLCEWEGITCNDQGEVVKIELAKNNLQGELPDIFHAFPSLQRLELRLNNLKGKLPKSLSCLPEKCRVNVQYNKLETTTLYVPRHRIGEVSGSIVCYPQSEGFHDFRLFVDCDVDLNPTQGYHPDNSCQIYQKATKGRGINIYIVGDGYDKAEHAIGGTAEYWLERAAEAIFDIEPYNKLRPLFNVYIVYAYSSERGVGLFDDKRSPRFGYWQQQPTKMSNCRFNAQEIFNVCKASLADIGLTDNEEIIFVNMAVNNSNVGLYHGMQYGRRVHDADLDKKRIVRVAINPTHNRTFNPLIWHEFGGHCFGRLRDEYVPKKGAPEKLYTGKSLSANLDTESNPQLVKWARFIEDARYAHEKLGVYQGGYQRYHNVYRATETSIMRRGGNAKLRFNAPSRAEIYRRAMELAYPGWEFDYEEFVKFDLAPLSEMERP